MRQGGDDVPEVDYGNIYAVGHHAPECQAFRAVDDGQRVPDDTLYRLNQSEVVDRRADEHDASNIPQVHSVKRLWRQ